MINRINKQYKYMIKYDVDLEIEDLSHGLKRDHVVMCTSMYLLGR